MKPGKSSSLNPYAVPYIPISRRNAAALKEIDYNFMGNDDPKHVNFNHQYHHQQQTASSSSSDEYNNNNNNSTLKGKIIHGSYVSTSQSSSTRRISISTIDDDKELEEFDIALTYLEMIFPGISQESLAEVLLANKGDLDATEEMLRQLEMDIDDDDDDDCYEHLPDSLDIGDVIEQPGSSQDEIATVAVAGSSSSPIRLDSESKKPYV